MLEETSLVQGHPADNGVRGGTNGTNGSNATVNGASGGAGGQGAAALTGGAVPNGAPHEGGLRDGSCETGSVLGGSFGEACIFYVEDRCFRYQPLVVEPLVVVVV